MLLRIARSSEKDNLGQQANVENLIVPPFAYRLTLWPFCRPRLHKRSLISSCCSLYR